MGSRMEVVGRKHEPLPGPRCRLPLDGIAALRSTSTVHPSSPRRIAVWFSAVSRFHPRARRSDLVEDYYISTPAADPFVSTKAPAAKNSRRYSGLGRALGAGLVSSKHYVPQRRRSSARDLMLLSSGVT